MREAQKSEMAYQRKRIRSKVKPKRGFVKIGGLLRPVVCPACYDIIPADTTHECEVKRHA